jgi:hypothetical protein
MGEIETLTVHDADARAFLRRTDERYDVIIVDAYRPPYVPFYLATEEFFELVRDRLTPGGIVALNVATTPENHDLATNVGGTLATVLPRAFAWQPLRFNQIVIGQDGEPAGTARPAPADVAPLVEDLRAHLRPIEPSDDPWTDDRAPVEWVTDRMIIDFAVEGGRFEEAPLPTAP